MADAIPFIYPGVIPEAPVTVTHHIRSSASTESNTTLFQETHCLSDTQIRECVRQEAAVPILNRRQRR
jgi:hypothetical protein